MKSEALQDITAFLGRWNEGDFHALEELFPAVYRELHRLANRLMRDERSNHTLQATALVHEAFLSLSARRKVAWRDRTHFFAVSARLMRHILVDHARSLLRARRGGRSRQISLEGLELASGEGVTDLLALDEAMDHLATLDPRKAQVVELRFFGGLSVEETADLLSVSKPTVILDTRLARAWLYDHIYRSKAYAS